ncbi:hypothetical protein SAMN05421820_103154 [Pedobacter steynii]|uniref:Uncharacterized protein n=1 Tax=Pedobacter steynii TaxID=430522 RepID=A0A1G9RA02_9SPHI|nr:hypothetical protein [Pedobacter steynii]NQX37844.1 hypothetical protein [Pedobacter steynii]SDM19235.1 hypothetical protein SAMN05421820_103154 [Pedobacter steynii]
MKKNILFSALLLGALVSCKKKDLNSEPPVLPPVKLEYSKLSIEKHKEALEDNGINFLAKINTLPNEKFIAALTRLAELDLEIMSNSVVGRQIISTSFAAKNNNVDRVFSALTSANTGVKSGALNEFYGIYTFDSKLNKWTKTASGDKFEINYPATASATENNAVLTATYTASKVTASVDGTTYELPAAVNATLKVDGKEELKLASTYEFNTDGTPLKTNINLALGSFAFKIDISNDLKVLNSSLSISKGTETLFSLNVTGNGNTNFNVIKDAERFEEVLKNANTAMQIMNIQIAGQIDIKAIADAEKANENLPEKEKYKKKAEAYNANANVLAFYKKENAIIAKSELVSIEDSYTYTYYDYEKGKEVTETNFYYSTEPRLVFQDGSKLSMKEFTQSGFKKLITDFEAYANRF